MMVLILSSLAAKPFFVCVIVLVVLVMVAHRSMLVGSGILLSVMLVGVVRVVVVGWSGGLSSSFALGCCGVLAFVRPFLITFLVWWVFCEVALVTAA